MSDDDLPNEFKLPKFYTAAEAAANEHMKLLHKHMENYNVETSALRRKLQSKNDALNIMRKEIEKFRTERDQFKLMAETLQLRYTAMKRGTDFMIGNPLGTSNNKNVGRLLHETRERNIKLTTQVEALKQKLNELQGDIEMLRTMEEKIKKKYKCKGSISGLDDVIAKEHQRWKREREDLISHLENMKKKNAQLGFDFKTVIVEKEELITERDAYKCKAHRLNHELRLALKANESHPKFLDIDSIILENKYLHERMKCFEVELELAKENMNKYKTMLEPKRKRGIINLGSRSNDEKILSHKQVKVLLESGVDLPRKTESVHDLRSWCLTLLDNLNDKNLALSHQKKTNKILAVKIGDLEQKVKKLLGEELSSRACTPNGYSASQLLLHNYCPSLVDSTNTVAETTNVDKSNVGNITEDSGTMSSEADESIRTPAHVASEDGISSSLSTESGRSIVSSEYGIELPSNSGGCGAASGAVPKIPKHFQLTENIHPDVSEFASSNVFNYRKSQTSKGKFSSKAVSSRQRIIPEYIQRERRETLKSLPTELMELIEHELHKLDIMDFDEILKSCANTNEEIDSLENYLYPSKNFPNIDETLKLMKINDDDYSFQFFNELQISQIDSLTDLVDYQNVRPSNGNATTLKDQHFDDNREEILEDCQLDLNLTPETSLKRDIIINSPTEVGQPSNIVDDVEEALEVNDDDADEHDSGSNVDDCGGSNSNEIEIDET